MVIEVMIWVEDCDGLFVDFVVVLVQWGVDIVGVMINIICLGKVLDIFYIQNVVNQFFGFDDFYLMDVLVGYLQFVVVGILLVECLCEMCLKCLDVVFQVIFYFSFLNDFFDVVMVIEVFGWDCLGLFVDLFDVIVKQGLFFYFVRIDGYGEWVMDVFYVM